MSSLTFKLAFASLFRRKLRTFLVIFIIASSLWGLIFMQGFYDGMTQQLISNSIKSDSGELSIYGKNFRDEEDVKFQVLNIKEIEENLKNNQSVLSHSRKVISSALVATASYSSNAKIYGINLESQRIQNNLDKYLIDGDYNFGKKNNGAIVGFKLANKLKLKIGKKIIVSTQNINNEVTSIALKITAIIKTNNMGIDKSAIFINIDKSKELLGIKGIHQISIMLKNKQDLKVFQKQLQNKFKNVDIYNWEELYPALIQNKEMMTMFSYISFSLVFFIATIGIFGVILVSVLERLREFGILMAIGTKFSSIVKIIFLESLFMGMVGFIIGSFLSFITLYYFNTYGLDLSSISDALDEFGIDAITYTLIKSDYFIISFFGVFISTILSVIIPLRVLKKSKSVEVING